MKCSTNLARKREVLVTPDGDYWHVAVRGRVTAGIMLSVSMVILAEDGGRPGTLEVVGESLGRDLDVAIAAAKAVRTEESRATREAYRRATTPRTVGKVARQRVRPRQGS